MARALGDFLLPLSRGHTEGDRALGSAGASISNVQPVERTQPVDCRGEVVRDRISCFSYISRHSAYGSVLAYMNLNLNINMNLNSNSLRAFNY